MLAKLLLGGMVILFCLKQSAASDANVPPKPFSIDTEAAVKVARLLQGEEQVYVEFRFFFFKAFRRLHGLFMTI